jgi:hypothetical protein
MYFPSAIHHPVRHMRGLGLGPEATAEADARASAQLAASTKLEPYSDRMVSIGARVAKLASAPFLGEALRHKIEVLRKNVDGMETFLAQLDDRAGEGVSPTDGDLAVISGAIPGYEEAYAEYEQESRRNAILAGLGVTTLAAFGVYFIWKKT